MIYFLPDSQERVSTWWRPDLKLNLWLLDYKSVAMFFLHHSILIYLLCYITYCTFVFLIICMTCRKLMSFTTAIPATTTTTTVHLQQCQQVLLLIHILCLICRWLPVSAMWAAGWSVWWLAEGRCVLFGINSPGSWVWSRPATQWTTVARVPQSRHSWLASHFCRVQRSA